MARILIVEDDSNIAELGGRYLEKAGYATERLSSGREVLAAIAMSLSCLVSTCPLYDRRAAELVVA